MSTLAEEIRAVAAVYPESRSAVLPALRLAQERHGGWLPPEAFVDVGEALGLTPAYCLSVASFYDMFKLEPVGRHLVEVCTNISCALVGAQQVLEAFESELGCRAGETSGDGKVTLGTVECLGGCGWGTVVAVDHAYRLHVRPQDAPAILQELGMDPIVLAGTDTHDLTTLAGYEAVGGYRALQKARAMTPAAVIDEFKASSLRGRGGAFFPTGMKWSFVPKPDQLPKPHYLVVNADESEPGSFKDNEILSRVPHRFVEGCLITAHAVESKAVFVYVRGEYTGPYAILVAALEELKARPELLGGVTVVVHRGAGAYICGEETALLESLEGKRGQPRTKPPFPAVQGLYASPTVVNNVETMSTVAPIIAMGGAEYAKLGVANSAGTRLVSLSGHVVNGGNYEIENGLSLRDIIYGLGGGIAGGRKLKAVIPGGSSTVILKADEIDVGYDFDSLKALNTAMGSAGIICLDDRCCMVQLGIRVSEFYEHESCGKCTPCREGTRWMTAILRRLEAGDATQGQLDLLLDVCDRINGKCLCPLGETAAMAVASYVGKFRDEFQAHIERRGCPFGDSSPLHGVLAPVAQHHHHAQAPVHA